MMLLFPTEVVLTNHNCWNQCQFKMKDIHWVGENHAIFILGCDNADNRNIAWFSLTKLEVFNAYNSILYTINHPETYTKGLQKETSL